MWRKVTENHRNVKPCDLSAVDKRQSPLESLSQRAKRPSSGGATVAYSSSSGLPRGLPLFWSWETTSQLNVGPSFSAPQAEEKYEQIR